MPAFPFSREISFRRQSRKSRIFQSKDNPIVYEEIHARLLSWRKLQKNGEPRIELEESTDEDPYSSVHLICKTRARGKSYFLEVQVRTIFEDAWAEIEHPLRYKGTSYLWKDQPLDYQNLKRMAGAFIKGLKKNLDNCLTITDDIQALYSGIDGIFVGASAIRYPPDGGHLGSTGALDPGTSAPIKKESAKIDEEIRLISELVAKGQAAEAAQADRQIDRVVQKLDHLNDTYRAAPVGKASSVDRLSFHCKMDKAFLYTQRSKCQTLLRRDPVDALEYAKKALDLYRELDHDGRYSDQAILKFRFAHAARATGNEGLAQSKLNEAVDLLKKDRRIPRNHLLRVTIPRQQAFMMWRGKQEIWHLAAKGKRLKHHVKDQESILQKCRRQTKQCLDDLANVEEFPHKDLESMRAWNNYISYVWELKDIKADGGKLSLKEIAAVKDILPLMDREMKRYTRQLSGLDTALKASVLIHDPLSQSKYTKLMREQLMEAEDRSLASEGYSSDELAFFRYSLSRNEPKSPKRSRLARS